MLKRELFKKSATLMLAGALTFGIASFALPGTVVKAAPRESGLELEVSYEDETVAVYGAEDFFYYGLGKENKDGTIAAPKAYEAVSAIDSDVMDISWINNSKKQYLFICSNPNPDIEKPVYVAINAKDTKLKVKMVNTVTDKKKAVGDEESGYLTFDVSGTLATPGAIQWRKENAPEWRYADDLEVASYVIKGANLQFRVAPSDADKIAAGKIVKGKINAKAAAPKVTPNYLTQTVDLKEGQEYRTNYNDKWTTIASKAEAKVTFSKLGFQGDEDLVLYVRTKTTDKKLCSKTAITIINKATTDFKDMIVAGAEDSAITATGVSVIYKTPYLTNSGLVFTNDTNTSYQVAVIKKEKVEKYIQGNMIKPASASAVTALDSKTLVWKEVKALDKGKSGTTTLDSKTLDKSYVILYRLYNSKNPISSAIKVANLPAKFEQIMQFTTTNDVLVSTGSPITVSATGTAVTVNILVEPMFNTTKIEQKLVGVFKEAACTTKAPKLKATLTAVTSQGKGSISILGNKEAAGTYYVKMTVQGVEGIFAVVVGTPSNSGGNEGGKEEPKPVVENAKLTGLPCDGKNDVNVSIDDNARTITITYANATASKNTEIGTPGVANATFVSILQADGVTLAEDGVETAVRYADGLKIKIRSTTTNKDIIYTISSTQE